LLRTTLYAIRVSNLPQIIDPNCVEIVKKLLGEYGFPHTAV
jgi:hypothetical protein